MISIVRTLIYRTHFSPLVLVLLYVCCSMWLHLKDRWYIPNSSVHILIKLGPTYIHICIRTYTSLHFSCPMSLRTLHLLDAIVSVFFQLRDAMTTGERTMVVETEVEDTTHP